MCGWAQGCYTADVDALLFGAVTVYRSLSLSTANPKATQMARCRRGAVQRVLNLQRGGTQVCVLPRVEVQALVGHSLGPCSTQPLAQSSLCSAQMLAQAPLSAGAHRRCTAGGRRL